MDIYMYINKSRMVQDSYTDNQESNDANMLLCIQENAANI